MWLENKTFELTQQDIVKVISVALSVLMKLLLPEAAQLNVHFFMKKIINAAPTWWTCSRTQH